MHYQYHSFTWIFVVALHKPMKDNTTGYFILWRGNDLMISTIHLEKFESILSCKSNEEYCFLALLLQSVSLLLLLISLLLFLSTRYHFLKTSYLFYYSICILQPQGEQKHCLTYWSNWKAKILERNYKRKVISQ